MSGALDARRAYVLAGSGNDEGSNSATGPSAPPHVLHVRLSSEALTHIMHAGRVASGNGATHAPEPMSISEPWGPDPVCLHSHTLWLRCLVNVLLTFSCLSVSHK